MNKFWFILAALFFQFHLYAKSIPAPLSHDDRIKVVRYNSSDVVEINTSPGYATTIEFGNEKINAVAIGDSTNWQATPFENKLFIKSTMNSLEKDVKPTNVTVVTDKRNYYFNVYSTSKKNPTFILRFDYNSGVPGATGATKVQTVQKRENTALSNQKIREKGSSTQVTGGRKNVTYATKRALQARKNINNSYYKMSTHSNILIDTIYDNNQKTYFKFAKNQTIPEIYFVDKTGKEVILRSTKITDTLVFVDKIAQKFSLRTKDDVTCIVNDVLEHPERYALKKSN